MQGRRRRHWTASSWLVRERDEPRVSPRAWRRLRCAAMPCAHARLLSYRLPWCTGCPVRVVLETPETVFEELVGRLPASRSSGTGSDGTSSGGSTEARGSVSSADSGVTVPAPAHYGDALAPCGQTSSASYAFGAAGHCDAPWVSAVAAQMPSVAPIAAAALADRAGGGSAATQGDASGTTGSTTGGASSAVPVHASEPAVSAAVAGSTAGSMASSPSTDASGALAPGDGAARDASDAMASVADGGSGAASAKTAAAGGTAGGGWDSYSGGSYGRDMSGWGVPADPRRRGRYVPHWASAVVAAATDGGAASAGGVAGGVVPAGV